MSFMKDFDHLKIQMKDVVSATNNFDPTRVIGFGGFGKVYKGELSSPEGQITFAFKHLDRRLGQGDIEFWKEIMMLSKYKHKNLVTLMHFCIEDDEMILVYEYASRGSLDRYLSDASTLTWTQRLKISVGVAHGLQFLHDPKDSQQRVIHRDIKSANILLDDDWTAKVSDFGLSKVGPANQAHTYMVSYGVGMPGYCDPLYMELGFLSKESDVYSFGVVLFEILCGRLCYESCNREQTKILVPKWRRYYDEKRLDEIILPDLREQMDPGSLESFSAIAYQCVKKVREERPTMAEIVKELEFSLEQQEIFENVPILESSHSQMYQSLDDDRPLNIKPRFHDRADDDCSQSTPFRDEFDDSEGSNFVSEMEDFKTPNLDKVTEASSSQDSGSGGQRRLWVKERSKTMWEHYNSDECPDEEFKKVFRMSKVTFDMICDELDSHVSKNDVDPPSVITVRLRVAVCLYRLATGDPLRKVSNVFGLGKSTCHKLVLEVCDAIVTVLMPKFIQWPNKERLEDIKTEFGSISGIPDICGSIYTTHISVIAPKTNMAAYFNKKHTERYQKISYSITIQGVVDSRGVFIDVCIGYPGSMPVAKILEKSALSQRFNSGQLKNISILGGSNYPLLDWLLVPHNNQNKTWREHLINEKHGVVQRIAKDAFMRLKGRWAYLQKRTEVKLEKLPRVLGACCVLHNICEINNEAMDEDLIEV
ncbi:putative protein kinase RLK-Pelle-CrRLK1L-1 family [Helianthus annuus]|uniref:non-specific serine/threonine protein kinase n=1 Tax=Helianthus annuus TaxID=4232 RepID=A0A251UC61_HELAN|nr:receptor-like kinase LIP1 [Helianthus annuus]KAF5774514.1 putative protein kinase RLK-Pelle-CrRLK1L-1 family [Helianthus annuus]KAJ0477861.1 putative protein kinase RLK-Pelle-CrRLK1L-1 family [Helianthus annuus]KAJ0482454.1 putative protein kinase RLK-Pelle-CrRLK1L-1 family [Helianthus annuus]KAJ0498689.1 putative protein kinase RLK-Pelle-CrRLK1L-1 family [Helianthus annuus]KAJ0664703.1 putative protein kinase RLK-Pelle-CrRLK1L-1 family [Helianthus annuus]